jgi:2'-5' RNA ligase
MIRSIYDSLWHEFLLALKDNQYELDPMIQNPKDDRRGISAVAYLTKNSEVARNVSDFLTGLKHVEPAQYFYPEEDLHITLLSIISCAAGFRLTDIDHTLYTKIFAEVTRSASPITIEFKGVTASPGCVMIQGFTVGEGLATLRNNLREAFIQSGLFTSIDSRYKLQTAHLTAVRFRQPLTNTSRLEEYLSQYREFSFGQITLPELHLVFNDWYQTAALRQTLAQTIVSI